MLPIVVAGRAFSAREVRWIVRLVRDHPSWSRFALARAVCRQMEWTRPLGRPKLRECRDLLERLAERGLVELPAKRQGGRPLGRRTAVPEIGQAPEQLAAQLTEIAPVRLQRVVSAAEHARWRQWIGHYHYLGLVTPYGAQLRYFALAAQPTDTIVGLLQFSSAAWRLAPRDQWIGWTDERRGRHLGRVVQQSRFLIPPWVRVASLASHLLALSARQVVQDWECLYGQRPLLLETLVDPARFAATCYRAANWIWVGDTTGRGRMDRTHQRHGAACKRIFLYPLHRQVCALLRGGV